jgi:hypothetical protein
MRQKQIAKQDISRIMLARGVKRAEQYLIESKNIREIKDCFAAMVALSIYTKSIMDYGSATNWIEHATPEIMKNEQLLQMCKFLAKYPQWQPSKEWPWTKQEMQQALEESLH